MCDNCLSELIDKLTREEFTILELLKKRKCVNSQLTLDKTIIMPEIKGLTDFKFNNAMSRLELVGCVKRNTTNRLHKFYITTTGLSLISIYKKNVTELLQVTNY